MEKGCETPYGDGRTVNLLVWQLEISLFEIARCGKNTRDKSFALNLKRRGIFYVASNPDRDELMGHKIALRSLSVGFSLARSLPTRP